MPSSDQIASASRSSSSRIRADSASPQAACTRPPNGESTQRRQSPISSRNFSTTRVSSEGTTRVAACCSRRYAIRFSAARRSRSYSSARVSASLETASRAKAPIARPSSGGRPTPSPRQNGTAPGTPGAGDDDHPVAGDVLDPPRGRAEQERLAGPGLVDHLLVELADPPPVGQMDAVESAVGDRARVGDRELARALAPADRARGPVPDQPRAQLGELLRRIAPVEHVEHVLELLAGEVGERLGSR